MLVMNRFRPLTGPNSYQSELRVNPLDMLPPGGRWLDIGCGTGVAVRQAATLRPDVEIVAIDLERGFVDGRMLPANLRFVQGNAEQLPLSGQFDLVTGVHVLHFIDDKQACLLGLVDLLSPDGNLLANLDPNDIWIGDSWEEAHPMGGLPTVVTGSKHWGTFHGARSNLGGNRQGVTSRQSLYFKNFI